MRDVATKTIVVVTTGGAELGRGSADVLFTDVILPSIIDADPAVRATLSPLPAPRR